MRIFVAFVVVLAACAQQKAPVSDSFSDLAGMDTKSDAFSYRMKVIGSLDYGSVSASVKYTKSPRYRAFQFDGSPGDAIDVWVTSDDGDPVTWVLDGNFKTLAKNDDASSSTTNSNITLTLADDNQAPNYIVFRDYDLLTSHFTVKLSGN